MSISWMINDSSMSSMFLLIIDTLRSYDKRINMISSIRCKFFPKSKNIFLINYHDAVDDNINNEISKLKRYKPCSLDELAARTKFSKKEIQLIYQGFKQDCPYGIVNEQTFKNIYRQLFPFADTTTYARFIFSTFDLRSSGFVTFEDFLICLSTLSRGTIEDRLKWIFTLYDTKRSGRLTKDVSSRKTI